MERNQSDGVRIDNPCPATWSDMPGDERKRYCDQCGLHVLNLAALKRAEADEVLRSRREGERLCVRVEFTADGRRISADSPQRAASSFGKAAAAAALALGAGLAGCNVNESGVEAPPAQVEQPGEVVEMGEPAMEILGDVACPETPAESAPETQAIMGTPGPPVVLMGRVALPSPTDDDE